MICSVFNKQHVAHGRCQVCAARGQLLGKSPWVCGEMAVTQLGAVGLRHKETSLAPSVPFMTSHDHLWKCFIKQGTREHMALKNCPVSVQNIGCQMQDCKPLHFYLIFLFCYKICVLLMFLHISVRKLSLTTFVSPQNKLNLACLVHDGLVHLGPLGVV